MADSPTDLSGLQQASLRSVAGLVAGGAAPSEVFAAVAHAVAQVTGSALVQIQRYEPDDGALLVEVRDDGAGGARPEGSGLLGLRDRLALDGTLTIDSPAGGGTVVTATIPLPAPAAPS